MPIGKLYGSPSNPRKNDAAVDHVAASLQRFGWQQPIVAKLDGEVIAGNTRLKAAKSLGMTHVPVVRFDGDNLEATAYAVADNRTAEFAEWDDTALVTILEELRNEDALAGVGFESEDIDRLISEIAREQGTVEEDDGGGPPPAEPVTRPGDIWICGSHKVMCGDSTNADDMSRLIDGNLVDLVVTDPPYGIDANKMTLGTGKKQFHRGGDWDQARPDVDSLIGIAPKAIVWGGNYFADRLPVSNDWLCWHKKNDGLTFSEFELAWTNLGGNCRHLSHHWSGEEKAHPTQKPLAVIAWCLEVAGKDAASVCDPFLGSGTTLVAAHQLGRRCRGIEISPAYVDVAVRRWEKASGLNAHLAGSDRMTFDEIAADRETA